MKRLFWLAALILLAAGTMYFLTRPEGIRAINANFTRTYLAHPVQAIKTIEAPHNIDVLSVWNNTIVAYGMRSKSILQIDPGGTILHKIDFNAGPTGLIHSMSGDSNYLYCFDVNNQAVYRTNFMDSLVKCDTLPQGVTGCIKNKGAGYIIQKTVTLRTTGSPTANTIYSFKDFDDWGSSHRGQLSADAGGQYMVYLPFYNSEALKYEFTANKISKIITIDKSPVADMSVPSPKGRILSVKSQVINRKAAANSKFLFVHSYARTATDTASRPVIDVYSMETGAYRGSFAVPGIKGRMLSAMTCVQDKLVIGFNHKLFILPADETLFNP